MSNLENDPREAVCGGAGPGEPELLTGREVVLGGPRGMKVTRTLPTSGRRMVGAWCFADAYGPEPAAMTVPPHPHTGLQTVSWLVEGEVLHRDTLGSEQVIKPGQLNLMTAGRGIAHSEQSDYGRLHGAQLWVALPDDARHTAPAFEHHPDLPVLTEPGCSVTVLLGELGGLTSPATAHTPIVGAEIVVSAQARLPLRPGWEYAVLVLSGAAEVAGVPLEPGPLLYLGAGRSEFHFSGDARLLLLGGEPFEERIVMWWNFVGRSHEEIVEFRRTWADGAFGPVPGYDGNPLRAPELPSLSLKPRGRVR
ncbi:pirin family protein [Herbidospora mongoliensis]|uniref:pirin family protein n=1 Tax=Herbidospora mongoliensis TaxID=688067 RepID=UPI00082A537C|nr:pirin family protein [Herbidospora mongoliensis]